MILLFAVLCLAAAQRAGGQRARQNDFESHLEEAVGAQSAGDLKAAIAAYQSALAIQRDVPEVWANLGLMQHQAKDYSGALTSFTTAHQLQPKLFVPILFLGLDNLELGDRADAVRYLLMARQLQPNDPNIPMSLGQAYFGLKQFDAASLAYVRATELNQKNSEAWYRLGIAYLEISETDSGSLVRLHHQSPFFQALEAESLGSQGHLDEAAKTYRALLTAPHQPPCIRSSLGLILLRQGQLPEAESQLQQDQRSGGCLLANLGLIQLHLEKGETDAALSSLAALWRLDPGFVRSSVSVLATGLAPERLATLDRALTQAPPPDLTADDVAAIRSSLHGSSSTAAIEPASQHHAAGAAVTFPKVMEYYRRGEYRRCVTALGPAVSSASPDKLSILAACSFLTGDLHTTIAAAKQLQKTPRFEDEGLYWLIRAYQGLAVGCLVHAGEVEPDSIHLHELLAESYRDMGKFGAAETEYTVALNINPRDFTALIGAAANYLQEFRIDLASDMIQRALKENPSDPEASYIAGEVLIAQHKYDEAESFLNVGLAAKPELRPRIHALLGRIYASRGDTARAIEQLEIGISSDDDGSIYFQLGKLYQKTGQPKLADAAFEKSRHLANKR
ncbi:MAG TPA: tetratricopeptide repeat protein [Granulicella sp.]|nr:tetratricopeptide repeat protein [Granulicella sp.]